MKPTHLVLPRRMRVSDSMNRVCAIGLMFWTLLPSLYGQGKLNLLTRFDRSPDISVVEWMAKEVARLFSDAGLSISWQQNLQMNHWEITGPPVSVQFRGNCRIEPGALSLPTDGPMAWTEVQDGDILPFIEVDCGRIAEMVWQIRGTVPVLLVNRAFGLALGRVMAHELYHYLTRSTIHTESRLFRKGMTSMDLTLPDIQFDAGEIEALRTGMR
jgi:hypothetical protein